MTHSWQLQAKMSEARNGFGPTPPQSTSWGIPIVMYSTTMGKCGGTETVVTRARHFPCTTRRSAGPK